MKKVTFRSYHDETITKNDALTDHLIQTFLMQ